MPSNFQQKVLLKLKHWSVTSLILILFWLTSQWHFSQDWTKTENNSLSQEGAEYLEQLNSPLEITAVVQENPELRRRIEQFIDRIQQVKSDIHFSFKTPLQSLKQQQLRIENGGYLEISIHDQSTRFDTLNESELLSAIQSLTQGDKQWLVFLEGHGEKSIFDTSDTGYSILATILRKQGLELQSINLLQVRDIPVNTALLVLAAPQTNLLAGEIQVIENYLNAGGNLLWLVEPGNNSHLSRLNELLAIDFPPGVILNIDDSMRKILGIKHPAVIPVIHYGDHPMMADINGQSLFILSSAIMPTGQPGWHSDILFQTMADSWTETGELKGNVHFDKNTEELPGPLNVGILQSRERNNTEQRVAIIGDSDFLSNTYLRHGENSTIALKLFHGLPYQERFVPPPKTVSDSTLEFSDKALILLATTFIIELPVAFLLIAGWYWWHRRQAE